MDPKQRYIFTCSACDAPLKALAEHLGRQVACPSCGRVISVPAKAKPSVEGEDWWAVDIPDTGEDFFDAALPETAPVQPPVNKPAKPANPAPGTQRPEGPKQPAARPTASNPSPSKPAGNSAAPPARTPPATGSSPSGSSARPPSSAPRTTNPGQPAAPNSPRPAQRPASNTASEQANPGQANPAPAKPPAAGAKPAGQQPAGPGKSNTSALRGNAPASGPPAPVRRPPAPPPQPEELDADNLFGELPPAHGSNDTDPMEWLKQHGYGGALDDDFNDPLAPAATSGSEASNQYRARCRVCDAVIMVRPTQAGKQIRCPDCHSHFEVPPPPEGQSAASQAAPQAVKHDDALERPIHTDAYGKSAQDYMRAAEAAPQEKVDELFDNPDVKGWAKDIFGMFMDPGVILHIAGLIGVAIGAAVVGSIGGKLATVFLVLNIFAMLFMVVFSLSCGVAIMVATSNNLRRVQAWPISEPAEAIGYLMVVLAAVFIAGLPGFFVGLASFHGLTQVGFILVSLHILFPVVIMSMLDNNSVFGPISNDVLTSIKRIPESWMAFYITTGLLLTGLFVVLLVTSLMGSFVGAILRNLVIVFVIFLYMRILGRLGREVGTAINDMERELPVAKDDSAT